MNTHHCSTENTQSICFKIKRELHNWSHYKKTEGYSFLFRKRAYGVIGKNTVPNCVIIISWFFSYQPTVRKTRFESVWQKHAVMWDVCLKRSSSDYLSPISFFMFGLLCNVALGGGEVFCFRFKRLTNQLGAELLISLTICNLMVRRGKRCVGSRPSGHVWYPVVMGGTL